MRHGEDPLENLIRKEQFERAAEGHVAVYDKDPEMMERKIEFDNTVVKGWQAEKPGMNDFMIEIGKDMDKKERAAAEKNNAKVSEDWRRFEARKETFEKKTKAGRILEDITKEMFQYHLKAKGFKFEAAPDSDPDDGFNGGDVTIRIEAENESEPNKPTFLYFSLDVTTSGDAFDLEKKKIFPTALDLEKGKMPHIDYYLLKSDENEPKGRREMPHLVIGLSSDKVFSKDARPEELYQQYLAYLGDKKGQAETLEKSPIWREFFSQMKSQLVFHLEPCLRAYIHAHREDKDNLIDDLSGHLKSLQSLSIDDEIDSSQLKNFRQFMVESRPEISAKDPYLADNLYKHLDLLDVVEKLDQEKSSQGIGFPRASVTENVLEMNGLEVKPNYLKQAA
ncbi:MAG: hypothetical protein ABIH38_05480 [Patescibacteria group bacterium]